MDNKIKIIKNCGVDNDGLQAYIATFNHFNVVISYKEGDINDIHLNVNIEDTQKIVEYLNDLELDIDAIYFNMNMFQGCNTYTMDIYLKENRCLKNEINKYQKELKRDTYAFFRYYTFYQLGLQLEWYAGPDSDMIDYWNKNIEKIDILAQKYGIYKNYLDVEDKYGEDCFDNYIIPKTHSFFECIKKELFEKENDSSKICNNCKYCKLLFYFHEGEVVVPLNIPTSYFCTKTRNIIDENNIKFCNHYKEK